MMLGLSQYRDLIRLDQKNNFQDSDNTASKESLVDRLLQDFVLEELNTGIPESYEEKRKLLLAFVTKWHPSSVTLPDAFKKNLDQLLQLELQEKEITSIDSINSIHVQIPETSYPIASRSYLWKGDITTLKTDAIVNAANNRMLGCFQPFHRCIDNAIHCAAGVQLREDCYTIMQAQGMLEQTGVAKITSAYNLPSRFVLHTVGPIVKNNQPLEIQKQELASCYTSCLDLAKELHLKSIAFCSISTGLFGYPIEDATRVALKAVSDWVISNPSSLEAIVFNVFSDRDEAVYKNILTHY